MYGTSDFLGLEKSHKLTLKFLNTIQNSELLMNLLKTRYHYTSDRLSDLPPTTKVVGFPATVNTLLGSNVDGLGTCALQDFTDH
jgi:hypothetical protein